MRAMSPTMTAAAQVPGSLPALRLELADTVPHFATVATPGRSGPCAAAIGPDGAAVTAIVGGPGPGTVYAQRVSDTTNAGQWNAASSVSSDARTLAGVCLCVAGGTVRLIWQAATTTALRYVDSTDNGTSWSAPATLFDPGHPCYGIAADGDLATVLIAYDTGGAGAVRLAAWHFSSGAWSGVDWSNGDLTTITGVAATRNADGSYGVIITLQDALGEAYSLRSCVYTPGGSLVWTTMALVVPVDAGVGVVVRYPQVAQFDGAYRLSYQVADTGVTSGSSYTRVARAASSDFLHWSTGLEDGQDFPYGAAWIRHATGYLLVGANAVRRAPIFAGGPSYHDCTPDITRLELIEREGRSARLVCTLDNSTGIYTTLAVLVANAQLLLSQGYQGAGLIPTHLLYLDEWTFVRGADERSVVLVASDRARFLQQQSRYALSYSAQQVGTIVGDLASRAGFETPAQLDTAVQFSQSVPLLQAQPGQRYAETLARALAIVDGSYAAQTVPGVGIAFGAVDRLRVVGKSLGDPVVWHYAGEPEHLQLTHSGDRANHVVVYGAQGMPGAGAEAWDFADANAVGQERYALVLEGFAATGSAAATRASLALAREIRLALRAMLLVAPHPGLELFDVLQIHDSQLPVCNARIVALNLTIYPLEALYELAINCEGL